MKAYRHIEVSAKEAKNLAKAAGYPLPKDGYEALVTYQGERYWLRREGRGWLVHGPTDWVVRGGRLFLKNPKIGPAIELRIWQLIRQHERRSSAPIAAIAFTHHDVPTQDLQPLLDAGWLTGRTKFKVTREGRERMTDVLAAECEASNVRAGAIDDLMHQEPTLSWTEAAARVDGGVRENPKIGKHPDIFAPRKYLAGGGPSDVGEPGDVETDVVVEDWRLSSPDTLRYAVRSAALTGDALTDVLTEMGEYEDRADADGDVSALVADGMSRKLANAVAAGLHNELLEVAEAGREARIESFVEYMRDSANAQIENETEPDNEGYHAFVDRFQQQLEDISFATLHKAAAKVLDENAELLGTVDNDTLEEILRDPDIYTIERRSGRFQNYDGGVWSEQIGDIHDYRDGAQYDELLTAILHGGEHAESGWGEKKQAYDAGERDPAVLSELRGALPGTTVHPGLTDEDLHDALTELENHSPYVYISAGSRRGKAIGVADLDRSFDLSIVEASDDSMVAVIDADRLSAKLAEVASVPTQIGPEHDDIVYRYAGTHDSIAGPSGKGLYVAKLQPKDLKREGSTQGICIGREENGHPKALREGKTQVFSIRTESGKPKFTIELGNKRLDRGPAKLSGGYYPENEREVWDVLEVKGKANRLAGFELGKDVFTKADDLRLVTDFLTSMAYTPEYLRTVRDIAPGIQAAEESGMDPFAPPVRKKRPERPRENPARASQAVRRLLAKAQPMGNFRSKEQLWRN